MTSFFNMGTNDFERIAEILRTLAHPMRLLIVQKLLTKNPMNVSELQQLVNLPQSTVSQHLSKLKAHTIVSCNRKGLEVYYQVNDKQIIQIMKELAL